MTAARVVHLQLKPAHGAPMQPAQLVEAVAGSGLRGDAAYGRAKRQVLVIERETLEGFGLAMGEVRENVVVEGLTVCGLPPGARLRLGPVLLEATMDCSPCEFIEGKRAGLRAAMQGRRGTLFRVIEGGEIKVGDAVALVREQGPDAD